MLSALLWGHAAWTRWCVHGRGTVVVRPGLYSYHHASQVASPNGEVIITNDGATILQKMTVTQPAAKMLVELSRSQVNQILPQFDQICVQHL